MVSDKVNYMRLLPLKIYRCSTPGLRFSYLAEDFSRNIVLPLNMGGGTDGWVKWRVWNKIKILISVVF